LRCTGSKDVNISGAIRKYMTDVSLCFEVHQPIRLKKGFFWNGSPLKKVALGRLMDFYFDEQENHRIFDRISSKCYLPTNRIILDEIRRFENSEKPFKVAYSFSGVFLDQCSRYSPDVLESFIKLIDTGKAEVMEQTYYHSLSSLYNDKQEFFDEVKMHKEQIWDIFGLRATTFENTELLYNNQIAQMVESMGYKAIFTEGVVADPNYVYRPSGIDLSLLMRNYQLTDDIGFRFSATWWEEYPLTADKYSNWLSSTPGQCINIFCDYETFGEHQWPETGIFEFLKALPREVIKKQNLEFATPSEIAAKNQPIKELSIEKAISWADLERDTSCWLGNALQWACYTYMQRLAVPIKESQDQELMKVWRTLGLSDHLYYMFTWGGGAGEVHSYFSPYSNAYDAAVTFFAVLSDLHFRIKERLRLADAPFEFSTGFDEPTGDEVWSLEALHRALAKVDIKSIEFHMKNGDMANWALTSIGDQGLADKLEGLRNLRGERLRKKLIKIIEPSLREAEMQCQGQPRK
jgi:alpha-amylase